MTPRKQGSQAKAATWNAFHTGGAGRSANPAAAGAVSLAEAREMSDTISSLEQEVRAAPDSSSAP